MMEKIMSIQNEIHEMENKLSTLYLESADNDPEGYFSAESFDISFNQKYLNRMLEKVKGSQKYFNQKYDENNISLKVDFSNEHVKNYSEMIQVLSHEMFHLYQSLTLPCMFKFIDWKRKVIMHKWYLLNMAVAKGFKYKEGDFLINPNSIENADYGDFLEELEYCIDDVKIGLSIMNHSDSDLALIDLIEGSAVSFQLIQSKDINFQVIPSLKNRKRYNYAYERFLQESGIICDNKDAEIQSRIVFLFITHLSMRCDEDDYKKIIPMFLHLCKNGKKYMNAFPSSTFSSKKFLNKPNYKYHDNSYLESLQSSLKLVSSDNWDLYIMLCDAVDIIVDDIKENSNYFLIKDTSFQDEKSLAINDFLIQKFPIFHSTYFIPLLITDYNVSNNFVGIHSDIKMVKYKSFYKNAVIATEIDIYIVNVLKDLESMLLGKKIKCCDKHGFIRDLKTIVNCNGTNSYNNFFKILGDKKLTDFIEV